MIRQLFRPNGVRMAAQVNLDALIPRLDFEVVGQGDDAPIKQSIQISDLESSAFFYAAIRKPDFQRETSEWDPKRVVGLVRSFIHGELIPGIILWQNKELLFVIDGSHRFSALVAWVHNDYGDGEGSQKFFEHAIPDDQARIAQRTRKLIEDEFGSYADHKKAIADPDSFGPDMVQRGRRFGSLSLPVQWVRGDAAKAENSFVRINQQAVTITPEELELIKSRKKPNAIAARAIIRKGTGHQYWSSFAPKIQKGIKEIATEVYALMFSPALKYPIKSLDLPAGGAVYSATALRMVYDFITLCVGKVSPEDDAEGQRTNDYLVRCRRVMQLVLSNDPASVGLHPAVYFYSWTGKQQPILFLTIASLIIDLERSKKLGDFINVRGKFEEFLTGNRSLLNQVIRKFGTKSSGTEHLRGFYDSVLKLIADGQSVDSLVGELRKKQGYSYLQPEESPYDGVVPTRYSTQVKAGLVMKQLLETAPRCHICGGVVPTQAISVDHKKRKSDGGLSSVANARLTHPYCNTGYKESSLAKKMKGKKK